MYRYDVVKGSFTVVPEEAEVIRRIFRMYLDGMGRIRIQNIEEQKKHKADRRRRIEIFLRILEEQKECLAFDPCTFVSLTDKVIIRHDRSMQFLFRNGMTCEHSMI